MQDDPAQFEDLPRELTDCNSCGDSPVWVVWWQTDEDREDNNQLCSYCETCYKRHVLKE